MMLGADTYCSYLFMFYYGDYESHLEALPHGLICHLFECRFGKVDTIVSV